MILILRSDPNRYSHLQESLFEGVYKGRDEFPVTVTAAYDMLQNAAGDITQYTTGSKTRFSRFRFRNRRAGNVTFTQTGQDNSELVAGTDRKLHPKIQCRLCHKWGHYANQCAHKKNK